MNAIMIRPAIILLALTLPASAQKTDWKDHDAQIAKLQKCRFTTSSLIGMNATDVKQRCGRFYTANATVTAAGRSEQLVYGAIMPGGPYFYVYVEDGVVTAVQTR